MIHSPSRSYNEALAGVGLLNHPQRVSRGSIAGVSILLGCSFAKTTASSALATSKPDVISFWFKILRLLAKRRTLRFSGSPMQLNQQARSPASPLQALVSL